MKLTYSKGACLAFALDLLIKHISSGQKSFDDLMKMMLERYDYRINQHCFIQKELDGTFRELLGKEYFSSYQRLFGNEFIREFQFILDKLGLQIEKKKGSRLYFGIINYGPPSSPLSVLEVDRESSAYKAGLREGDILLGINSHKIENNINFKKYLEGLSEDDSADLTIQRGESIMKIKTPWLSYKTSFEIKRK